MHVRKRIFAFLFAAFVMLLCTACGKWDYSREAMKAANDAQGENVRVTFEIDQKFTSSLRGAAEDNIQPADVKNAMAMDKTIEKLLTAGYRLDIYALRADTDAAKAAAQLADEFVSRLAGCEEKGYISMVKADNGYFYEAVLVYRHGGNGGAGAGSDGETGSGGEDDESPITPPEGKVVTWKNGTLTIWPSASSKMGDKLTEKAVADVLVAQGDIVSADNFSLSKVVNLEVKAGSGVTVIGEEAFDSNGVLTTINMPEVTTIGQQAFFRCNALTGELYLPKATTLGNYAFYECSGITSINLPIITTVGVYAFGKCTSLSSFNLPEATDIELGAFSGCTLLEGVLNDDRLPEVKTIGSAAFAECGFSEVNLSDVTTIVGFAMCDKLTKVIAPNATTVGAGAFQSCTKLSSVYIPKVTTVDDYAFYGCQNLKELNLPKVETIGISAFTGDNGEENSFEEIGLGYNLRSIAQGAFYQCNVAPEQNLTIYYGNKADDFKTAFNDQKITIVNLKDGTSLEYVGWSGKDNACDLLFRSLYGSDYSAKLDKKECPAYAGSDFATRNKLNLIGF